METSLELYAINREDLRLPKEKEYSLDSGPFSTITVSSYELSKRNIVVRNIETEQTESQEAIFKDVCLDLLHLDCKCMMPISYIILPDNEKNIEPAICTPFYPNRSLKNIITRLQAAKKLMNGIQRNKSSLYMELLHF